MDQHGFSQTPPLLPASEPRTPGSLGRGCGEAGGALSTCFHLIPADGTDKRGNSRTGPTLGPKVHSEKSGVGEEASQLEGSPLGHTGPIPALSGLLLQLPIPRITPILQGAAEVPPTPPIYSHRGSNNSTPWVLLTPISEPSEWKWSPTSFRAIRLAGSGFCSPRWSFGEHSPPRVA